MWLASVAKLFIPHNRGVDLMYILYMMTTCILKPLTDATPPQSSSHSSSLLQSQVLWTVWYRQEVIPTTIQATPVHNRYKYGHSQGDIYSYNYNDIELLPWDNKMLNSWLCTYLTYTDHTFKLTLPSVLHIAILLQFIWHTHTHLSIPGTKEAQFIVHTNTHLSTSHTATTPHTSTSYKQLRWTRDSVLPLSVQVRMFKPGRSRQDFSGQKKSSAHLPSEGK